MKSTVELPVTDLSGQRTAVVTVDGDANFEEVAMRAVDALDLPWIVSDEPAVYHTYNDLTGESLVGPIADFIARAGPATTILVVPEMNPARGLTYA